VNRRKGSVSAEVAEVKEMIARRREIIANRKASLLSTHEDEVLLKIFERSLAIIDLKG
jgi:hypothetical protein